MLHFLIKLESVESWPGAKDTASAAEHRVLDATDTGCSGTLLLLQLPGASDDLSTFFGLMGTLSLVGKVLFCIQVDRMIIRFYTEDCIIKIYLSSGFLTFYVY